LHIQGHILAPIYTIAAHVYPALYPGLLLLIVREREREREREKRVIGREKRGKQRVERFSERTVKKVKR